MFLCQFGVNRPVFCNTLSALLTHTLRNDSSDVSSYESFPLGP